MATESVGHKIVKAMFVVGFFWLFWKFGGFLIMGILAKFFPPSAGPIADAYAMTYNMVIFTGLFATVLKVIVPAFMPIFIEVKEKTSEEEAWKLANTVLNLLILGGLLAVCAGMLYPETVLETLAPGFGDRTRAVAADLLRMMLPGAFLLLVGTMALALLNSYKVFGYPAAGDALQKFLWAGIMIGGIMGFRWGAEAIAYGFLVGCVGQTIINLVGIGRKLRFYRPDLPLLGGSRIVKELGILACFLAALWLCQFLCLVFANALEDVHLDIQLVWLTGALLISCGYCVLLWYRTKNSSNPMARFAALAGPILISILFARYRDLSTSFYQTFTMSGVYSSFRFARSIGDFPHVILTQTLAIAMLPYLCDLAAKKDWQSFGKVLTGTLRILALIFIPLTAVMILLSDGIVQLAWDRGNWSAADIHYTATALRLYIWGLVFFAIENALMQSFFSTQRVWWPTILGIAAAFFHVVFIVALIRWLGFDYPYDIFVITALSLPASKSFKNLALLLVARAQVRILPARETLVFLLKLAVVTAGVTAAVKLPYDALRRRAPLDPLKERRVIVDTFNREAQGWSALDADLLKVSKTDSDKPDMGAYSLGVRYRVSGRRPVWVERELHDFRVGEAAALELWVKCSHAAKVRAFVGPGKSEVDLREEEWSRCEVSLEGVKGIRRPVLTVGDVSGGPSVPDPSRALWIDNLALVMPNGRKILLDSFEEEGLGWRSTVRAQMGVWKVGEERRDERALRSSGRAVSLRRDLQAFNLARLNLLGFKTKTDQDLKLTVSLTERGGAVYRTQAAIPASETREAHRLDLAQFILSEKTQDADDPLDAAEIVSVTFAAVPAEGRKPVALWLDNLEFSAKRSGRTALMFEGYKFVLLGIPCLAGLIVFVVLIFVLRMEEGQAIVTWLKAHGLDKLKGKRSDKGGGARPQASVPVVE